MTTTVDITSRRAERSSSLRFRSRGAGGKRIAPSRPRTGMTNVSLGSRNATSRRSPTRPKLCAAFSNG